MLQTRSYLCVAPALIFIGCSVLGNDDESKGDDDGSGGSDTSGPSNAGSTGGSSHSGSESNTATNTDGGPNTSSSSTGGTGGNGNSGNGNNGNASSGSGGNASTASVMTTGAAGNGWSSTDGAPDGSLVGAVGQTTPGVPGVWEHIDLPGVQAGDLFEGILHDPVRPSDFYFNTGEQGRVNRWWKSTDYGATWELINDFSYSGRAWGASIDPNPDRDPETPPTIWSPAGYGDMGAWKSVDGGYTWQQSEAAKAAFAPYNPSGATDLYHIQILPDDPPNHVLATYHYGFKDMNAGGLGETWDGGETWVVHLPVSGMGTSHYVIPISATTWCLINQEDGIWRTTTAGRVGGTAEEKYRDGTISTEAWTKVDDLFHFHGSHQSIFLDGAWYVPGITSMKKSTDEGATWQIVVQNFNISEVTATDNYFYGTWGGDPSLSRAPRNDEGNWVYDYVEKPAGMGSGTSPYAMSSAFDPESGHWVVLMGSYDTGLWRYVEP